MDKSERNNEAQGITGLLCYGDSIFLQILEGDRTIISNTYHRISLDKRHHTPELIECVPIESRTFAAWSMKAINLNELNSQQVRNLILNYSTSATLKPYTMTPQQCLKLMTELADFYNKTT
jgi:hypothetical protein